jgi:hypothetical protein
MREPKTKDFEGSSSEYKKPTRGGMQRHIRFNPETRRCTQEPFPQKT